MSDSCSWSPSAFAYVYGGGDGVYANTYYASFADDGVRPFALLV